MIDRSIDFRDDDDGDGGGVDSVVVGTTFSPKKKLPKRKWFSILRFHRFFSLVH